MKVIGLSIAVLGIALCSSGCGRGPASQEGEVKGHILWAGCSGPSICSPSAWTSTPIWFQAKDGQRLEAISDPRDGSYAISLRPGAYDVILPQTLVKGSRTVIVRGGQTTTADYTLNYASG